jgi:hypothetical protein
MKIRILKPVYSFLEGVNLPLEVEAEPSTTEGACEVHENQFIEAGCDRSEVSCDDEDEWWPFENFDDAEFEVVQ